jgi:hypothetical protein
MMIFILKSTIMASVYTSSVYAFDAPAIRGSAGVRPRSVLSVPSKFPGSHNRYLSRPLPSVSLLFPKRCPVLNSTTAANLGRKLERIQSTICGQVTPSMATATTYGISQRAQMR